jgi:hypothetical protein
MHSLLTLVYSVLKNRATNHSLRLTVDTPPSGVGKQCISYERCTNNKGLLHSFFNHIELFIWSVWNQCNMQHFANGINKCDHLFQHAID